MISTSVLAIVASTLRAAPSTWPAAMAAMLSTKAATVAAICEMRSTKNITVL